MAESFRRCRTSRRDQDARTPAWLLRYVYAAFGGRRRLVDPAPAADARDAGYDALAPAAAWGDANYVNPPFAAMDAFLRKGADEVRRGRARHVVFLAPCTKFHCAYFASAFPHVTHVQLLSRTVAFAGYAAPLPHPLALVHMGPGTPPTLGGGRPRRCELRLLRPPTRADASVERVCDVLAAWYACPCVAVLAVRGVPFTEALRRRFGEAGPPPPPPFALLLPARIENRWIQRHVLGAPACRRLLFCAGTLAAAPPPPGRAARLWTGSLVALYFAADDDAALPPSHPWESAHASPVSLLDVDRLRAVVNGERQKHCRDGHHRG